ncbi:MAG TPA: hypothetical protein PK325_04290 [Cyclobacteriaceae bacterium]|nr:hypothetical protein [Cyclobacteriaceae bacterium]HMV89943.1 hypothetical protein [Cyclobacteriaceae bacterium]HMX01793.1 hypothetical protein [Cyclobacteriaceae bacterium]HMX51540.1 hypothetical protein [Cyclobacteriaceae bacterium]HMY95617.1 hypothetical protein [Cyclobacteriaceae bacterium]
MSCNLADIFSYKLNIISATSYKLAAGLGSEFSSFGMVWLVASM